MSLDVHVHVHVFSYILDVDTWSALQERFNIPSYSGVIRDLFDGQLYRNNQEFLSKPANVSLTINTDGVAIFRSSKASLWPVWVQVNSLKQRGRVTL